LCIDQLPEINRKTEVTIAKDNNASEEEKAHSEANWKTVLEGMKKNDVRASIYVFCQPITFPTVV
jgi:hypothetical protein